MNAIVPLPQIDVAVRDATLADIPFIDRLQKMHNEMVGFMATSWLETRIEKGQVIIAEERTEDLGLRTESGAVAFTQSSVLSTQSCPLGYCISVDRYLKRDDVGIVYQLCVAPGAQRKLIGASLLKSVFDRAAYGCRLFCCWCAQDLAANRFWEAMGFVPLAFRAGSEKKRKGEQGGRVHIFWQKRIRAGDERTDWWYPCQTNAGAIRADRIVLPIPPGRHWSQEMPAIVPAGPVAGRQLSVVKEKRPRSRESAAARTPQAITRSSGLKFVGAAVADPVIVKQAADNARKKMPKVKNDPKLLAAAREIRDRWMEQVNAGEEGQRLLSSAAKYDVCRLPKPPRGRRRIAA